MVSHALDRVRLGSGRDNVGSTSAQRTLDAVIARTAVVFRSTLCVLTPLAAVADGPPAGSLTIRNIALLIVFAWGGVVWHVCRRERRLPVWIVLVDASLFGAVAANAATLAPADIVGEGSTWVSASLTASVLLATWSLPWWWALAITTAMGAAFTVGEIRSGSPLNVSLLIGVAILYAQFVLNLIVVRFMRRTATATDRALRRLDQAEREREISVARVDDATEHRLTLHGTVLATLTAVSRGGLAGRDNLVQQRARRDLDQLTTHSDLGQTGVVNEATLIAAIRAEAEIRGISLTSDSSSDVAMPQRVAHAVLVSLTEGLSNIERHASVESADLRITSAGGTVTITLADRGVGFDVARPDRTSIGLRESIGVRMAAVGGTGKVMSAPGTGTTVVVTWSSPATAGGGVADPFGTLLADAYATGLGRTLVYIAAGWHLFTLMALSTSLATYRSELAEVVAWVAFAAVAVWLLRQRPDRQPPRGAATIATAVVTAATCLAVLACQGEGLVGWPNWAIGDYGWFLVALTAYVPVRRVLLAWLAILLVGTGAVAVAFEDPVPALGHLLNINIFVGYLQVGALVMYGILRRHGTVASAALQRAHQLETERAAAEAVAVDRAARFANLESTLLPFMRGLADGSVRPDDPQRQSEAWVNAGVLRALLDHDVGSLSPKTIDSMLTIALTAAAQGVAPGLDLDDVRGLPEEVAHALVRVAIVVLEVAEPGDGRIMLRNEVHSATVTVCVAVAVTPARLRELVQAGTTVRLDIDVVRLSSDAMWLEARWTR